MEVRRIQGTAPAGKAGVPGGGSGKAGVFCGDVFCCLNYDTQRVELYKGSSLLGIYSQAIGRTANADLRGNPAMYTVEMRIRGNRVRVYSGASYTLRFTASISGFSGGYAGYCSDSRTVCELLRLGDAWIYEPYERFDVTFPDGRVTEYGRIARNNAVQPLNLRIVRRWLKWQTNRKITISLQKMERQVYQSVKSIC